MKILNRKQFLALPAGVIYTKFMPCLFGDLAVKKESISSAIAVPGRITTDDWHYHDFMELAVMDSGERADKLFEGMEKDISIPMDFESTSRDGFYDQDQLFAVLEKEDVFGLIHMLKGIVPDYPEITKTKDTNY